MKKESIAIRKVKKEVKEYFENLFDSEISEFKKEVIGKTITEENEYEISKKLWTTQNMREISYDINVYIKNIDDENELFRLKAYVDFMKKTGLKPKIMEFIHERLFNYFTFCNGLLEEQSERFVAEFKNNFLEMKFLPMSVEDIQKIKSDFEKEGFKLISPWKTKYIAAFEKENEGVYYFESWYEAKKWLMG
ncbi:MAG: hypothetical protein IJH61_08875 [Eubacteriaceae bacterium]|nr:hypothetical protein [Eubacteriaceae bacterium]